MTVNKNDNVTISARKLDTSGESKDFLGRSH